MTFRLSFVILAAAALALSVPVANAHRTGTSHRTDVNVWMIGANVPSTWDTALINAALTWDNVPNQCHDFQRITSGNPEMTVYRNNVDGAGGTFAFSSDSHNAVTFDMAENWNYDINNTSWPSGLDVWGVGTHEYGHNLSLTHADGYPYDTMAPQPASGNTSFSWRSLTAHDELRERNLYPGC